MLLGLKFLVEVSAARLLASQGVNDHQFTELQEVSHPAGTLQALVEVGSGSGHRTFSQNSSRSSWIIPRAFSRPSLFLAMPQ
jgi:hypothetical protein